MLHTPETALDLTPPDTSAEAVARYFATTDRPASAHECSDSDSYVPCLPDTHTAFHVRGYNSRAWGIEISSRHDQWRSAPADHIDRTLRMAAPRVAQRCRDWGVPVRRLDRAPRAGESGIAAHSVLDPSRRRDPGADFPWEPFLAYVRSLVDTAGGPDMPDIRTITEPVVGPPVVFPGVRGYAQVDSLGGFHAFGNVPYYGSVPQLVAEKKIPAFPPGHCTGAAPDHDGDGYLIQYSSGHLFAFNAEFQGRVEAPAT